MTKRRKKVFREQDILKNSGREVSHVISAIKKHERLYLAMLAVIFMVTICFSGYLALKVDSSFTAVPEKYQNHLSMTGSLLSLSSQNVLNEEDGLKSSVIPLSFQNGSGDNVNYVIRLVRDQDRISMCDCEDKIVSYQDLRFSLDGKTVQKFQDGEMVLTTGMIPNLEEEKISLRIWIDESVSYDSYYYGKFLLEELEEE